jgi:hypothetical protein
MQRGATLARAADEVRALEVMASGVPRVATRSRMNRMNELIFLVEDAPEGGYTARALGESIFTEADDVASLEENVRDAVRCHFEPEQMPHVIRLHFTREQVIAV